MDAWSRLVTAGVAHAISALGQMVDREITITTMRAQRIQIKDTPMLVGGPEAPAAAVYISVTSPADGHMMLMYRPEIAFDLIRMLLGEDGVDFEALGDLEESALAETGNVVGSFFLNALSDLTGVDLRVSPPAVMLDMAGAVLDVVIAQIMSETDEALVVETTFGTSDRQIDGTFLAMPSLALQRILLERWEQ
jgi:chemotaxis protein CheC